MTMYLLTHLDKYIIFTKARSRETCFKSYERSDSKEDAPQAGVGGTGMEVHRGQELGLSRLEGKICVSGYGENKRK